MKAQERLWLTADRKRLVPDGHKEASTLYAAPGDEIPESAVKMFGLKDGWIGAPGSPDGAAKPRNPGAAKPEKKETAAPENKQADKPEDKSLKPGLTINKLTRGKE